MDRTGQRVRLILVGNRFYSGTILEEDENFLVIRDKFQELVTIGKGSIISFEEVKKHG